MTYILHKFDEMDAAIPTPCPRKKTSHFDFCHNFTICWGTFTIFEAFCSGI